MAPTAPLLGVSACLLRAREVLLVERTKSPFAGLLSLPGGRVEFGESLDVAIRREITEETGLAVALLDFHRLHEVIGPGRHAVIAVFRGILPADADALPGDDAASLRFVAIETLDRLEAEGHTTPGLAAITRSAAEALLR